MDQKKNIHIPKHMHICRENANVKMNGSKKLRVEKCPLYYFSLVLFES